MPIYTYRCENCQHQFDKEQSFYDDPLKKCPNCKKLALRKVYRPARVVFKGSGYYVTDNKGTKSPTATSSNGKSETSDNGKSEKKSETTTEKKSEKKESKAKED